MSLYINNITSKLSFEVLAKWSFFLLVMTLPLGLFLNTLFSIFFFLLFTTHVIISDRLNGNNKLTKLIIMNLPLLLPFLSLTFSENLEESAKILFKTTPIFFFSIFAVYKNSWFKNKIKTAFKFLVAGCLLAAVFCWAMAIYDLFSNGLPLIYIFNKEFSHHHLSGIVGVHTPYLALFINTALIFMLFGHDHTEKLFSGGMFYFSFTVLVLFLVHLMARNAIFCLIIYSMFYLIWNRKWTVLLCLSLSLSAIFIKILLMDNNSLRDRLFSSVNLFEKETVFKKQDKRFVRWSSSLEVFRRAPIFGVGTGGIDFFRKKEYLKRLDSEAYNLNYNSHNQYIEYLSTYGLLGSICLLFLAGHIFKLISQKKSVFLAVLFFSFLIAMLTESMMVRAWGISFFGILYITLYSWE